MYVCDRHLRDLLPDLAIVAEEGTPPFNADEQIQPSSIDLRLSQVFWKPIKRSPIDLRRSWLLEIQPRRYYRKTTLQTSETIVLKPFELLLGRTLEEFSVPGGYAAELTGRSSFSRMGLMVHATDGYINPGWRGRMPLQLLNVSPSPIKLFPSLPICQIRLIKLTGESERPYGDPALQSIYVNDDGGPSYWWRDKRIKKLHTLLAERSVHEQIQRSLHEAIGIREPEVIERLEKRVSRLRLDELQSADAILEGFSNSDEHRRTLRRWAINISRGSFTVGISVSLWIANKTPICWWHYLVWLCCACLVLLSIYAFRTEVGDHFGGPELRAYRERREVT